MPIGPGTRVGSYVVNDAIGQGAMGVVYRAYHAQLERTAAVKVLQAIAADPDTAARFRREAQAIARMRHPNVLNVFDFGEVEGTPFMVVEYVEGGSLATRVKNGPLDRAVALAYLHGIGEALDYAHKHGIVHRDVKPANVLLGPDDNPILADFGLAKLMESSSIKSLTGVTTGTPAYMAPEQVTGSQVGPAADRYSLAVMAYEMLTGTLPFDEGGVLEVLYAQVHKEPAPPSMLNHDLPTRVDAVILRGMSKEPAARWERCRDFVAALEKALKPAPVEVDKTIAFAPPAAAVQKPIPKERKAPADATTVMAVEEPFGPIRGPDPTLPHPVITRRGKVVLQRDAATRPRRWGRWIALGAIVLILLAVIGAAAFFVNQPLSLSLSTTVVNPGDSLIVTADHLPSNQAGEIQLLSNLLVFPFSANLIGRVTRQVDIPYDIDAGDHLLRVCWNGSCPLSTFFRVNGTTPVETPSPSPSPIGPPSSAATLAPTITVSPATGIVPARTLVTVDGSDFTPNHTVVIYVVESGKPTQVSTAVSGPAGNFIKKFTLPPGTPAGAAAITACDAADHCGSAPVSIA